MEPRRLNGRIYYLLFKSNYESARFLLAMASFIFSMFLLMPGETLDLHGYELMRYVGPDWIWATAFFFHAWLAIWNIIIGCENIACRLSFPVIGFVLWGGTSFCLLFAQVPLQAGFSPIATMAFFHWIIIVRSIR